LQKTGCNMAMHATRRTSGIICLGNDKKKTPPAEAVQMAEDHILKSASVTFWINLGAKLPGYGSVPR
jgi:hypothetical protein